MLVSWAARQLSGDKNAKSRKTVVGVEKLIAEYAPQVIVLEDASAKGSLRSQRIRRLTAKLKVLAKKRRVKVALFTRKQVMRAFLPDGKGTRHDLAAAIAERFPGELGPQLPPKRKFYETEDYRIGIFMAAALALTLRHSQ